MWFAMLLGHIVGDFILQNDTLAKGKSKPGTNGHFLCAAHCLIYSICVASFVSLAGWECIWAKAWWNSWAIAYLIAYFTHFPIDRWSLGLKWMNLYGQTKEGPFAPIVYVGVDNGAHLVLMWAAFTWLAA